MKLEYKRELDQNYMIMEEEQIGKKDSYEIYMLTENQIPGLLKCIVQQVNQRQRFCYEVTSRQSLDILLERKRLTHGDLLNLLKGIQRAMSGAREYLLDVNHLMLRPKYIYWNLDQGKPEFCYFPYYEKSVQEQFFELAEYLLGRLERQDRAGVELGYEIYKMAGEENCSLEEILCSELAQEKTFSSAEKVRLFQEGPRNPGALKIAETTPVYGTEPQKKYFWSKRKKQKKEEILQERKLDEKDTMLSDDEDCGLPFVTIDRGMTGYSEGEDKGETCILSADLTKGIILYGIGQVTDPLIITGESFLIGKKRDVVDGYVNHPTISRIHARIERREQEYYLVDLNSTNGTYLNQRLLEMNETVPLKVGDSVRFADVEYIVGVGGSRNPL